MARVVALYRYPVKGFTPEARAFLTIRPDGRVAGDRVLGFRFADTPEPDDAWSSKHGMLALVNTPGLARLRLRYDETRGRLSIRVDDELLVEDGLDRPGRQRLCQALADFMSRLDESDVKGRPDRLPLRLVGDGETPRYHDSPEGTVTLHGLGSLDALRDRIGDAELDGRRFRSNIVIDGVEAWEELAWTGQEIRIGSLTCYVKKPNLRCLATHANPETGERDRPVMTTLTREFGQEQPTFAIALLPNGPGEIRVGDQVEHNA